MTILSTLRCLSALVGDTFRQSRASGVTWVLLTLSLLAIAVCASVNVNGGESLALSSDAPEFLPANDIEAQDADEARRSGVQLISGNLSIGFGSMSAPLGRDAEKAVRFLQQLLACGVADTLGILAALMWTASFTPNFLDPRTMAILLAKPASRSLLLSGKCLGVVLVVMANAALLIGGTWIALGARTGVWTADYLWSVPLLGLHFFVFFSFSLLLAACFRATAPCVIGSVAFWILCWSMNFAHHSLLAHSYQPTEAMISGPVFHLVELGYWVLPKPADLGMLLTDAIGRCDSLAAPAAFTAVREHGDFHPLASVLASVSFALLACYSAVKQFAATDY